MINCSEFGVTILMRVCISGSAVFMCPCHNDIQIDKTNLNKSMHKYTQFKIKYKTINHQVDLLFFQLKFIFTKFDYDATEVLASPETSSSSYIYIRSHIYK